MKKVAMLFGLFVLIFVASLGFVSAYETYSVSNEQLNEGYTSPLIKNGDTLTFSIDEQARKIMLSSVVRGQVLLSITPLDDMQYVSSGEEKKYELTGDNSYDISIRLEEAQWSEYFGQENATIFIKRINEDVPEGTILPRSCIYKYYECPDGKKIYNCGYSGTGCGCRSVQSSECEEETPDDSSCNNYYWFDNANKECSQKQFCGTFMYEGLQTFETKRACEKALNGISECVTDADCSQPKCGTNVKCLGSISKCINGECKIQRTEEDKDRFRKFLPWQKRNESECPEGCKCRGAVVSCETEDGRIINITAGNSGRIITIVIEKIEVNTTLELETISENNKTKLILNLPDGRNVTLKVLPPRSAEKARERLGEMNFTIELKKSTITKGNETRVVYELVGDKHGRFLGLFKTKGKVITEVDAETGEVTFVKKPWWSFLASGI